MIEVAVMDVVEILKALGDGTRLRILHLLYKETLCVCDLEAVLNLSQSNASRHLIKLKHAGLIVSDKQAQWVYYRVDKTSLERYPFVRELLAKELEQQPHCQKDFVRLTKYQRQGGCCETRVKMEDE
ncbi:ArsR/SmtB family transcription factor [Pelosinus fermentans]|uniref:Transcriptional regulator, ArsR family n=1 Tax=Pelosinus fermentans JBW45 TaxID=1192197 RepID=I9DMT0_9FIRM|nr:metalloregulator ArsR/SmtB family transcription factor [Pelosinus fermentans]AJQ26965.1 transcriptional regulator, ArsR family [Pelosinus fermentans JBW45]